MATVANEIDRILQAAASRSVPDAAHDILMVCSAPGGFKVATDGTGSPASITFSPARIGVNGAASFTATNGATLTVSGDTATLTFANMPNSSTTVTVSASEDGQVYSKSITISKVSDGAKGDTGPAGTKSDVARLYQWASTTPAKPTGTSTFTWGTLSNGGYSGTDGWSTGMPDNPGTPGLKFFVASVPVSAAGAATTNSVSYTSATVAATAQNGANGTPGLQSRIVEVYQWAATLPIGPVGNATLTWSTGAFGAAPSGWQLTPGTAPSPGMSLWRASVLISDSAANTTTGFNWGNAGIAAISYAGTNGGTGADAAYVVVSNNGQVFSRATSSGTFAPASLALTATPYGGTATYQWQYWTGSAWANVATGGTSATYTVASGDFVDSRAYRVQATIGGKVYTDQVTLLQITGGKDGANAVNGFLTNESATLAADSAGTLVAGALAAAGGTFKVYDGVTDKTGASVTYSVASQTGCTVAINASGVYSVSAMSADSANAVLQAVYNGVTIQKTLSLAKAKAGASVTGQAGVSYIVAYCVTTTATSNGTAPAATTGKAGVPAANSSGLTGTWSTSAPASVPAGSYLFQTGGLYDPATDKITWAVPYWSYAKFATLSALVAYTGDLTVTGKISDGNDNWSVLADGTMTAKKFILIDAATGAVMLQAGGVLNAAYVPMTGATLVRPDFTYAGLADWTNQRTGSPAAVPTVTGATLITNDADFGTCGEFTTIDVAGENVLPKGVVDVVPGRVYKITITFKCVTLPDGPADWGIVVSELDAAYAPTAQYLALGLISATVAGQVYTASYYVSTAAGTGVQQLAAGTRYFRAGLRLNTTEASAPTMRLKSVRVEDATESYNAQQTANTANAGLAGKLNADAASTLTGPMTVSTTGGISIGTLTWNASGGRTGGYGVGITSSGIAAYNTAGLPTFVLDATNGNATFYGTLSGASGSLGSVHLYSGGIHGGAYSSYAWIASGQAGFYLGPEGLKLGCLADNKYFNADQFGNVWAPGFTIVNGVLTLTNPNITGASMDSFTATLSGNASGSFANGQATYGTLTANPSGGKLPYSYRWTLVENSKTGGAGDMKINSTTSQSATFSGSGTNATLAYSVTCIVTDANGRAVTLGTSITANHGTPP